MGANRLRRLEAIERGSKGSALINGVLGISVLSSQQTGVLVIDRTKNEKSKHRMLKIGKLLAGIKWFVGSGFSM